MSKKVTIVFVSMCVLFLIFSFRIYLRPLDMDTRSLVDTTRAGNGRLVWQKYNCQSCHQLYGLGGYLGPDLTNCISNPQKGELIIRPMVQYGVSQMPGFNLSNDEMEDLIAFLKSTDASGKADPRNFTRDNFGMIRENENQ